MKNRILLLAFFVISAVVLLFKYNNPVIEDELILYSGNGLRIPMTECVKKYKTEYPSSKIKVIYAGSNVIANIIMKKNHSPSLFVAGSKHSANKVKGIVLEQFLVAHHCPVLIIHSSLKDKVKSLSDCFKKDVVLAVGNSNSLGIGAIAMELISGLNNSKAVLDNIKTKTSSPQKLVELLKEKRINATVVWNDLVTDKLCKEFDLIKIKIVNEMVLEKTQINCMLLRSCGLCDKFFEFMKKESPAIFASFGFEEVKNEVEN